MSFHLREDVTLHIYTTDIAFKWPCYFRAINPIKRPLSPPFEDMPPRMTFSGLLSRLRPLRSGFFPSTRKPLNPRNPNGPQTLTLYGVLDVGKFNVIAKV